MIILQDKYLVSDDVLEKQFVCNLNACKGACCWEGDAGAPLEEEELSILDTHYDAIKPFLSPAGKAAIQKQGGYTYERDRDTGEDFWATTLIDGGPCAYMTYDGNMVAQCGIEKAFRAGVIDFYKPISCHLYPIRVDVHPKTSMILLNYHEWSICKAACAKGEKEQVAVYEFLKAPLIRKFGLEFYEELEAVAEHLKSERG